MLNPGNEGETRAGQTSNGARVSPTTPFSGQPSVERKPSLFDPSEPEGLQLIRLFESVGVRRFGVTLFDEPTQNVLEYLTLSATAFRRELPIFLQRNAVDPISIIGRPLAHHVIQLDDLGIDTQREFHATAFAILHTSPAHFTAWLALPVGTSKAERVEVRRRLLQRFDCTDAGASGATRWPGSRNVKHTKEKDKPHIPVHGRDGVYPKVRLFYRKPGRHVAVAELEKIYQLPPAPEPPPPQPNSAATLAACRPPCKFPDYETELARAPRRKDGSDNPDRSVADLRWSILALRWRWPIAAVEAKLDEVSSKELRGAARRRHVRRTVAVAARAVGLLG